jgi:hypothetical protein
VLSAVASLTCAKELGHVNILFAFRKRNEPRETKRESACQLAYPISTRTERNMESTKYCDLRAAIALSRSLTKFALI